MTTHASVAAARTVFGGATVVLIANQINLSIFKPVWLLETNILRREEFSDGSVITPEVIQIPTPQFTLVILPNRLQMAFAEVDEATVIEPLNRVLGNILLQLPHTPYAGLGFNFDAFIGPSNPKDFADWNRDFFNCKVANASANGRARFGCYYSIDFEGMRLKINVRPIQGAVAQARIIEQLQTAEEWMHFDFNFHLDLDPQAPVSQAINFIQKWPLAAAKVRSIISEIPG